MEGKSVRDPNLDFVRALAITMVIVSHLPHLVRFQAPLRHGVDVFFVLSGFLIGRIFLGQEREGFRLLRFWADRWLRTLPAYFFVLLSGILLGACFGLPWRLSDFRGQLWQYALFVQNYGFVSIRNPTAPFPVSWSLCVEEQFYLTLPLVLLVLRNASGRLLAVGAVIAAGIASRVLLAQSRPDFIFTTHFRFDGIGFGVLASLACDRWPGLPARLRPWGRGLMAAWLGLIAFRSAGWPFSLDDLAVLNAAAALTLVAAAGARPFPGSTSAWSRHGAAMAYCLYLVHYQAFDGLPRAWNATPLRSLPAVLMWPTVLAATYLAAWIVHALAERPGLALRQRFRRRFFPAPVPKGVAAVA